MPVKWILFRIVCILQMLGAAVYGIMALLSLTRGVSIGDIMRIFLFTSIFFLTVFAMQVLNNNYPDTPVAGKQKVMFNRLFLVNFLFLVFLFGIIFAEYTQLTAIAALVGLSIWSFSFSFFVPLIISIVMLLFQLTILYGLYLLRRELFFNYSRKEFEFEKNAAE